MKKQIDILKDIFTVVVGSVLFSISIVWFLAPHNIAPGGVSGLSTLINYMVPSLSIGLMTAVLNIPVVIIGILELGKKFMLKTVFSTLLSSATTYLLELLDFKQCIYQGEPILAALFGGALMGFSIGLLFSRGYTTGGTDVLVHVVKKHRPQFSLGALILFLDAIVVTASAIVYRNIDSGLYAVITIFISSSVIDKIMDGLDSAKLVYVVSDQYEKIASYIANEMDRGVTLLHGKGFYSGHEREVVMVVLRPQELYRIRHGIKQIDPNAFIIFTSSNEVLGEGFKEESN